MCISLPDNYNVSQQLQVCQVNGILDIGDYHKNPVRLSLYSTVLYSAVQYNEAPILLHCTLLPLWGELSVATPAQECSYQGSVLYNTVLYVLHNTVLYV